VWLIHFALPICDICRSDRGLVLRVTCVQSRIYILYHRCRGQHLSLYVRTCDCLSYICTVCLYSYNSFPCMYETSYIYMSFNWCQTNRRGSSEFVLHTGNSLVGNPCVFANVCLSSMYSFVNSVFQVLVISLLCLPLPSIFFSFHVRGKSLEI